jgi:hypothetical protein
MPRNGSGGYTQPVADFVPNTLIDAADVNAWFDDLGNETANSLAKDGQTSPTADLPMGGFKHTGVANATAPAHYTAYGQLGWELLSSSAVAGVSEVTVNWTENVYQRFAVHIIGWRYASGSANNLFARVRRGGSTVSGASDYVNSNSTWIGGVGAAGIASLSLQNLTDGGSNGEPISFTLEIDHHESGERPVLRAFPRWTNNTPTPGHGLFTSNVSGGSGWLSGVIVGVSGGTPNITAGRITVLGLKAS